MKPLFLDFDGVLNSSRFLYGSGRPKPRRDEDMFDPACVARLARVLDQTGAQIVVSSSWRHSRTPKDLERLLWSVDLPRRHRVVGRTGNGGTRGDEIQAWLCAYPGRVERFAIVDDMSTMGRVLARCFVQTNPTVGLDDVGAERLVRLLGYQPFRAYQRML